MSSTLTKFRPLKPLETYFEVLQSKHKLLIVCYLLRLESKNEVSEEQIKEALKILFRNICPLHLCIRKENGVYWFYKMAEEKIPLQVVKNQSAFEVFANEVNRNFDSESGPLWRATYVTSEGTVEDKNTFTSTILFTFHHALVDGYTAVNICNSFLKTLNDVIGETVQKIYDFGHFNDGHESDLLEKQRTEFLMNNPEYLGKMINFQSKLDKMELLTEHFPVEKDVEKKTKFIHGEINKEINTKLIHLFKSKEISFHAGFCSILHWTLMEIFTEKGFTGKEIELPSKHIVNLRRYWKKSSSVQFGSHVLSLTLSSIVGKYDKENFWEYAKKFNKELKNAIENMQVFDQQFTRKFMDSCKEDDANLLKQQIISRSKTSKTYYNTSNMGDISSVIKEQGNHVRLKYFSFSGRADYSNKAMTIYFQTFEGRLMYCITYSSHLVKDDFDNAWETKIKNKFKIITNSQ